jgi:hypothetical protein
VLNIFYLIIRKEPTMDTIKIVIGVILIVISFIYLIKNPSQSMMDGLLKKKRVDQEKLAAEYKAMQEAKAAEAEDTVETSQE